MYSARATDARGVLAAAVERRTISVPTAFVTIVAAFALLTLASWPILFSFDLWVFKDRSSFLNLDYMVDQHLRLGVDAYYGYGLLPVLLQRLAFAAFGRGFMPMVGFAVATLLAMALFWTLLIAKLPRRGLWLAAIVLMSPVLLWVNPNFPNSLLQLSLLYALLCLLYGRRDLAFAVAAAGCWCVPSLTLVMTALAAGAIVLAWLATPQRRFASLARELLPGIATYFGLGLLLGAVFGFHSVFATALPLSGAAHYRAVGYGLPSLLAFLHPAGHSLKFYVAYYVGGRATWWVLSSVTLAGLGLWSAASMISEREVDDAKLAVVCAATIMALFTFVAYGSPGQHIVYDPVLAAGTIVGLALLPLGRLRLPLTVAFVLTGILGHAAADYKTLVAWRTTKPSAATANLYAQSDLTADWVQVLDTAAKHRLLLLSYATGVHHYFPTVASPSVWSLEPGQILGGDKQRILNDIHGADVIVEDLTGPTAFIDSDPDIARMLAGRCLERASHYFLTWVRTPGHGETCLQRPPQRPRLQTASS